MSDSTPKERQTLAIAFSGVVALALLALTLQLYPWSTGLMAGIFNGADTPVYEELGSWIHGERAPYLDYRQSYPPLDLIGCAIPHLLRVGDYRSAFVLMNTSLFLALAYALWRRIRSGRLRATRYSIWLLALPSVVYNAATFNDLWAAGTVLLAFLALAERRNDWAIFALSLAVFMKSYPLFLLPPVFLHILSQGDFAGRTASQRLRGYRAALQRPASWHLVGLSIAVAVALGSIFTIWVGLAWFEGPLSNFEQENGESLAYLVHVYAPFRIWVPEAALYAKIVALAISAIGLATIDLRSFENTVRLSAVIVIASSMTLTWHSPHWNLWFFLLLCTIRVDARLFAILALYDLGNLAAWPFISRFTPIEALQPFANEYFRVPVAIRCALEIVLIGLLLTRCYAKREDSADRALR